MMIDLRSDTVTKPTPEMRRTMAEAVVGDDVFLEDPTANALQRKISEMFGFEAGLFVPSGTMGNQLSLNIITEPGDEVLIEETGHIFNYEAGGAAHLSSVQLNPITGERGKLSVEQLEDTIRGGNEWEPRPKVLSVENTTNKGGGSCYTEKELIALHEFTRKQGLFLHLDGARIWNAIVATGTDPQFYGSIADTMSVCFSKGLGAPVGSMVMGSEKHVQKARRMRKMWGGGMRQIGILAAAADYAVEKHLPLLKEDHRRAKELAQTINTCQSLSIDPETVETNILIFDVLEESATSAVRKLADKDIEVSPFGPKTLRVTFHFQITDEDLRQVKAAFENNF